MPPVRLFLVLMEKTALIVTCQVPRARAALPEELAPSVLPELQCPDKMVRMARIATCPAPRARVDLPVRRVRPELLG